MARKKADTIHENHKPNTSRGIKFLTDAQRQAWEVCKENRISFLLGASGAGKSQIALAYACQQTFAEQYEKVIVSRPCIEAAGESLGYLKGTVDEKTAPYLAPAMTIAKKIGYLIKVEFIPIGFLRGVTFEQCIVVVEEAQNCNIAQLKLILSRLGPNSKIIFTGDDDQRDVRDSGLDRVVNALDGMEGVGIFEFQQSDCVRDPMISGMLDRIRTCCEQ